MDDNDIYQNVIRELEFVFEIEIYRVLKSVKTTCQRQFINPAKSPTT